VLYNWLHITSSNSLHLMKYLKTGKNSFSSIQDSQDSTVVERRSWEMHSLPAPVAICTAACCPFVLLPFWHCQCWYHPTKKPQTPDQNHQIHRPSETGMPLVDTVDPGSITKGNDEIANAPTLCSSKRWRQPERKRRRRAQNKRKSGI
jgi:hypothetical protein